MTGKLISLISSFISGKWFLYLGGAAVGIGAIFGGIAYHNSVQREIGAAKQEAKYAALRQKGAEVMLAAKVRGEEYAKELGAVQSKELKKLKSALTKSEAARATEARVFAETNKAFADWSTSSVPEFSVSRLREHQRVLEERFRSPPAGD